MSEVYNQYLLYLRNNDYRTTNVYHIRLRQNRNQGCKAALCLHRRRKDFYNLFFVYLPPYNIIKQWSFEYIFFKSPIKPKLTHCASREWPSNSQFITWLLKTCPRTVGTLCNERSQWRNNLNNMYSTCYVFKKSNHF